MADTEPTHAPDPVYALAASPSFAGDSLCFVACLSGLRRSTDRGQSWHDAYASMTLQAPLTATSVAFSPDFDDDRTLFAGAPGGVLRSHDGGQSWAVAGLPAPPPFVTGLAASPNYREDGLVFAGTMEDGVLRSWDRGISWAAWNFGLLDLNVYALAISPGFRDDETLFVGVESGVFRSGNGGRAWRETSFPMEAAPVLCLAVAADYAAGGPIFAGTEQHGLWRSTDMGVTWQAVSSWSGREPINALVLAPDFPVRPSLLALSGDGVQLTRDGGEAWGMLDIGQGGGFTCVAAPLGLADGAPLLLGTGDGCVLLREIAP